MVSEQMMNNLNFVSDLKSYFDHLLVLAVFLLRQISLLIIRVLCFPCHLAVVYFIYFSKVIELLYRRGFFYVDTDTHTLRDLLSISAGNVN